VLTVLYLYRGQNKKRVCVVEMVDSSWVLLILYTSIISLSLASPGQLEYVFLDFYLTVF
jgi:hypothetical protein